jgi:hypothetical protein
MVSNLKSCDMGLTPLLMELTQRPNHKTNLFIKIGGKTLEINS